MKTTILVAVSGPHLKDVVLEGFGFVFFVFAFFPDPHLLKGTCIFLGLSKGGPLEEISFERSSSALSYRTPLECCWLAAFS